jgi:hypothetical protein
MTLRELCVVIPAGAKLRIKQWPSDQEGIVCVRYDVYDPLELSEIPELVELQTREVLQVRPDMVDVSRLLIILKKEKEA